MTEENKKDNIDILADAESLHDQLDKSEEFAKKNKNLLFAIAIGVAVIIAGVIFYKKTSLSKNEEAAKEIFPAIFYMEKDSLDYALNGDAETTAGFLKIADEYSGSATGERAKLYAGIIAMKKGEFDNAIKHLEGYNPKDLLIQARVYALLGDAYSEKGEVEKAISAYQEAISYKPNKMLTPQYVFKLALAYEQKGDKEKAKETYKVILDDYPSYNDLNTVRKYYGAL